MYRFVVFDGLSMLTLILHVKQIHVHVFEKFAYQCVKNTLHVDLQKEESVKSHSHSSHKRAQKSTHYI